MKHAGLTAAWGGTIARTMADLTAHYRTLLASEYRKRARKNAAYSNAAFAKALGMDRTYWAKLSGGKILLSLDLADQITKKLKLDSPGRAEFLKSVAEEHRCHSLHQIDPSLSECDASLESINRLPLPRRKKKEE